MSKAKAQGTDWETAVVKRLIKRGYTNARRIAEGGSKDEGDVTFEDGYAENWIVECKARTNYNVTQGLAKAKRKSGIPNTVVAWKKLVRKEGNERRTPDGEPDVVIMDWETFMYLVDGPTA